ncbi:MAG: 2-phosphosulfolactate phosphatase [Thermaceae bacterium]
MRLRVDPLPVEGLVFADVVLVVDVLRSTTTAAALLEAGASALYLTPSLEAARSLEDEDVILAGEEGGLKPPGFEIGTSPREALEATVGGRIVVMSAEEGAKTAHLAAQTAKHVLLASLYNAHAAARRALELATEEVAILCTGHEGRIGLDDLYTAGVLAGYLLLMREMTLEDGARIALTLKRAYPDPLEPLSLSAAAEALRRAGLEADVPFASQVARSATVPQFRGRVGEALIFKRAEKTA